MPHAGRIYRLGSEPQLNSRLWCFNRPDRSGREAYKLASVTEVQLIHDGPGMHLISWIEAWLVLSIVMLRDVAKNERSAITDSASNFRFESLVPGSFEVEVALRGHSDGPRPGWQAVALTITHSARVG